MLVGIHQLHYLPWLRYFEKIARVDVFVVLDNIQYSKNGWQNRNRIKTPAGATLLTVPVLARAGQTLDEVRINNAVPWRRKHWRTIEQSYAKAPFFDDHQQFLEEVYRRDWERLNDLNRRMLEYFAVALGITTPIVYASDLKVPGEATGRLINLVRAAGGARYYSGAHALDAYLDAAMLEKAGIALELQHWRAPEYPQRHGPLIPDLSVLDLLINCGPQALEIIQAGGKPTPRESVDAVNRAAREGRADHDNAGLDA